MKEKHDLVFQTCVTLLLLLREPFLLPHTSITVSKQSVASNCSSDKAALSSKINYLMQSTVMCQPTQCWSVSRKASSEEKCFQGREGKSP